LSLPRKTEVISGFKFDTAFVIFVMFYNLLLHFILTLELSLV